MATTSTFPLATSLPSIKYVPFDPSVLKHKTKSKPKAKNKPNITEHDLHKDGSHRYDGEWANIDNFSTDLSDSNALRSLYLRLPAAVGADGPSDSEGDLSTVPPPQIAQSQQPGQEGPDKAAGVEVMDLAVDRLFNRSSPEFPLALDNDAAGASHRIDDIQSSGGPREYQDDDLDAAGMRAFSVENTGGVYNYSFPEQDEPYDNVGMGNQPSATRKRKYALFDDTITSSVEMLDHTSKPDSEDSRSAKRRSAQSQAESFAPSPVCTLTSTTTLPQAHSSHLSPLGFSNDPNAGDVDDGGKGNGADTSDLPRSDLLDLQNGSDGEHNEGVTDKELLHSSRQSISPSEGIEGDQDVNPDSEGEDKANCSDSEVRESNKDGRNQANDVSHRVSATTFQQHKPSSRPFRKSRRGISRTRPKSQGESTITTRTSPQLRSFRSRHQSGHKVDIVTRSSPPTSSPGTRAVYDSSIYEPSDNMAYQLTDITLFQAPKGSLIVTAIVRCDEMMSKSSLNLSALERNFLGDKGQVIRITQVSPDSWLLLGYRYDDGGVPNPRTSRSLMQRNVDQKISPHRRAANHDAVHPDNEDDEEDENGDEDTCDDKPHATGSNTRSNKRTRVPWLESDERRLLAYKNKMGMKWDDIFPCFPDRTPGAVQARWHILQGKRSTKVTPSPLI
ncbi:hypothetical protein K469DRAFT_375375 [Zopfia rhizophila CBS 207.26]|uniref:Uncharacterized protein n=1 Tax=Zopfia rhizophila CBS 207.26 TaxID=1314779 RepID=A0A6A6DD18_9PEZI|nr:hypothetical protein K469DRAFT_375375 [Zopfia rhizophila CBS 207.26]